ncbi:MAG TPA: hypothetical protein VN428_15535 [Bryobacteraceae bacterium]|nr:hypothetical protein [Bryobacteraceae bacterium]
MTAYLIVSDPDNLRKAEASLRTLMGGAVRPFAWGVQWAGTADQLRSHLTRLAPGVSPLLIAEVSGDVSVL